MIKAAANNRSIVEVPVPPYPRTWGSPTGINWSNLYKTARELLRIKGMVRQMKAKDVDAPLGGGPDTA